MTGTIFEKPLKPLGYVKMSATTARPLASMPDKATHALLITETQAIRWRDDGTVPTTTDGMQLAVNTPFVYFGDIRKIQIVEVVVGAVVHVSYYGSL